MSKYILKKDLPFAKAGEEVIFMDIPDGEKSSTVIVLKKEANYPIRPRILGYDNMNYLIKTGWVEEVNEYRLAKDLPFAQKGMTVEKRHNDELGTYFWYVFNHKSVEWWQLGCDLTIDKSWIEEVKEIDYKAEYEKLNAKYKEVADILDSGLLVGLSYEKLKADYKKMRNVLESHLTTKQAVKALFSQDKAEKKPRMYYLEIANNGEAAFCDPVEKWMNKPKDGTLSGIKEIVLLQEVF